MNERRVPSFVLIVTSICALLAGTCEASRRIAESFFGNGVRWNIQEIDEDTAEQVWLHCREELLEITDDLKYIDLYIPQTTSSSENKVDSDIRLLTKRIVHKAIVDLPPQVKHNLLDCLNEESSPSNYSEKEAGLINWLVNWRELLSDWFSGPRRYLLRKSHPKNHKHKHKHKHTHKHKHKQNHKHRQGNHKAAPRPAEAPTPASASPAFAPAPLYLVPASSPSPAEAPDLTASPNPVEAPHFIISPAPASASPTFTPAPLYLVPASSPTSTVHSPVKAPEPSSPPVVKKSPPPLPAMRHPQPHVAPHKPTKSKGNSKESNTAVLAASSTGAFALIALFFCCCLRRRRNKIGHRNGHRDDKPLLNFCSSSLSAGSSQTSHGLGNSSKNDFSSSSNVNNLPIRSSTSLAEGQLSEAMKGASGDTHAPLPLPPGRTAPPHGISALPPGKSAPPPPKPPPPPAPKAPAPRAPPPPKVGRPPPPNPPKPGSSGRTSLLGPHNRGRSSVGDETNQTSESDSQKAKLKPFFWDKVLAKPDQSMVWHDLKAGSFQFDEEMMENLFGYNTVEKNKNDRNSKNDPSAFEAPQYIQIIDARKAQNLSILLRALNVTTEEVCDSVMEGNELPTELIQTMLKMAPTTEEELKLRLYSGDLSQLGPAERFLKVLVDIPFAFKRLESLLFMCSIQEEASTLKESFAVLEVACKELKNSRVFLKLLEAVLKTGNRMNDGTYRGGAQAFKLDTLLKLSDVKGIDGKTTLLHFVVLEIIRSEGIRAARRARENHSITSVKTEDLLEDSTQESSEYHRSLGLEVVSNLSNELANVKKAAVIDGDMLTATVSRLGHSLKKSKDFLNNEMNSIGDESEFRDTLASFVQQAEDDILWMLEEEKKITSLVKSTVDYFHRNPGKDEGLRLFMIVRDFLVMVDKVCQEVKNQATNPIKIPKKEAPGASPSGESHQPPAPNVQQRLFPAIKERRKDDSSSGDESSSP